MTAIAMNTSLSLSLSEFQSAISSMNTPVDERHPYPFVTSTENNGEVNVYNCKQILNQYCSICLGTSVQPKIDRYTYTNKPGAPKILSKVRFPTPHGWQSVTMTLNQDYWLGVDLEQVFSPDRSKKKSSSDKDEMCFVLVAVVEVLEKGFLDKHNRPDSRFRLETKRNCPLPGAVSIDISIKNTVFQTAPRS